MSKDSDGAIIYDYTSHAMKRIIDRYMNAGDIQMAFVFSEALHYYEQGLVKIQWVGGIPYALADDEKVRATLLKAGAKPKTEAEFLADLPYLQEVEGPEVQKPPEDENENPNDSE